MSESDVSRILNTVQGLSSEIFEDVMVLWTASGNTGPAHRTLAIADEVGFWSFIIALYRKFEDRLKDDCDNYKDRLAQCYQAVGALGDTLGVFGDENFQRLLDVLSCGKTSDGKDLLPFSIDPPNKEVDK